MKNRFDSVENAIAVLVRNGATTSKVKTVDNQIITLVQAKGPLGLKQLGAADYIRSSKKARITII